MAVRPLVVTRVEGGRVARVDDVAGVEEPLQIVLDGEPFAVIMRTPGRDRALTLGFLHAELAIGCVDDVVRLEIGEHPGQGLRHNVAVVETTGGCRARRQAKPRRVATSTSCGLCGRQTVESLKTVAPPISATWCIPAATLLEMPQRLRAAQPAFDATGGLHATGLFGQDGTLLDAAEDVGRHNAVDKVVGALLEARAVPAPAAILFVSGRSSYEIVQKAVLAGIPMVAAVSAPSTLAIELAEAAGVTLAGFVRGDRFNVYSHPQRIMGSGGGLGVFFFSLAT
jgi:FdhD protein